ncbi:oligopeptide/dipeptide ABC transporter ATP-binding protein [Desulfoluna sp.]|uniref:ABC transporter ATP-binding protein n=1 Tax=Desulfoluna sp. TaxID=2045199 RepID=UPI0026331851|nr:oligopeptide/dipeptide ABC transporter ATP-binding protein [Desulfoluna sp.]
MLTVKDLVKYFPVTGGVFKRKVADVHAVDGVSFSVARGETLGLVGESGCGKTTLGRTLAALYEATSGSVRFDGTDLTFLNEKELKPFRRRIQMVFQDPFESLNSRHSVGSIIEEPLVIHRIGDGPSRRKRVAELLDMVGLPRSAESRFPHEFSGGQRQRIGIARAIALSPECLICDEPVSALDVSIQSQIINLLLDLQEEMGLTTLFIAHDLAVVRLISDHVAVMYLGKIVEQTDADTIYKNPLHPYTQALISAIPIPVPGAVSNRIILEGDVPSPIHPPSGCRFHTRCSHVMDICRTTEPEFLDQGDGHLVACHLYENPKSVPPAARG